MHASSAAAQPDRMLQVQLNFNFNFKDMPGAPKASIRGITNGRDRHHTGKYGIKRSSGRSQLRVYKRFPGALALR